MARQIAAIRSEFIQLDQLIKWLGLTETGGQARWLVDEGNVTVNGQRVSERRKKIFPGDVVTVAGEEFLVQAEDA